MLYFFDLWMLKYIIYCESMNISRGSTGDNYPIVEVDLVVELPDIRRQL